MLCDTAADGTTTPFVSDYRRDRNGALIGFTDHTLGGAPCAPAGEVGVCVPEEAPCGDTEITQLCDLVYSPQAPIPLPPDSFTLTGAVREMGGMLVFSGGNQPVDGAAERPVTGLLPGTSCGTSPGVLQSPHVS